MSNGFCLEKSSSSVTRGLSRGLEPLRVDEHEPPVVELDAELALHVREAQNGRDGGPVKVHHALVADLRRAAAA